MKQNNIWKSVLNAAAKSCTVVEGVPSCATCAHAHPVPDNEPGSERNVYCRAVNYSELPDGLKIRRTEHCALYRPNAITMEAEILPIMRKRYGAHADEMMRQSMTTEMLRQFMATMETMA